MTLEGFWTIIKDAGDGSDAWSQAEQIQETLQNKSPEEVVQFGTHLDTLMAQSYSWNLWGAAYLINGGCSDDGFDYFRAWLICHWTWISYFNAAAAPAPKQPRSWLSAVRFP